MSHRPAVQSRRVRPPWLLAGLLLALFAVLLIVAGFADSQVGVIDANARSQGATDQVPRTVLDGGPIIDTTHPWTTSVSLPAHTVALTFDDGPDPTWTPKILAVLEKYHVPGTFFVIGSMAARHPELIRQIHDAGSEIGLHTFTHPDLVGVSSWQFNRELAETQFTLAGAAGITSYLLRPPYSSTAAALDDLSYRVVRAAGQSGYLTALTDVDSEDWRRPGVPAIVHNATPTGGRGGVVLMHDAGGDRSETVAALDILIPKLLAEGYRFDTLTGAAGLPPANVPASTRNRVIGTTLLVMAAVSLQVVTTIQWIMVGIGLLVIVRLVLMVVVARRHARARHRADWRWGPPVTEPVSVIVPAYNERANIEATLRSIVASDHPLEVIVVDDGSTDGTAELVERLRLPRVRLVRQENGGKASALNTGIAVARHELVVMLDGDTVFQPDTVRRLVQPFADPSVGAVAGNVKIANRQTLIGRLQHIEYVIGFNIDRRVHDLLGSMPTIPGAAGAFRRRVLLDAGGLSHDTLAEDTDLTIAIGRAGWRIVFEDSAIAWTEAPTTVRQLWQQRYRWTYGTMQAVWKHRRAVLDRGASGRVGRRGLLHIAVFQMALPLSAPLIDVFLVYGLFFLNPTTTLFTWSAVLAVQLAGAYLAFRWDRENPGTLWVLPLQQVIYRQLMYVVLVQSTISALAGNRVRWQKLRRVGGLDTLLRGLPRTTRAGVTVLPVNPKPAPEPVGAIRPTATVLPLRPAERSATTGRDRTGSDQTGTDPAGRERWPDLLRAIALLRVVTYHAIGGSWLTLMFPSMGVMFALAGSLMVRSLRRTPAVDVVGHRLRRLLPPLWLFGAVLIPVMFWHGWADEAGDTAVSWNHLVFWLLPIFDPPGSNWAGDATVVLWYLRAYLWFVLLTPVMLAAFRRRPLLAMAVPIALVAGNEALGAPLANWGLLGPALLDAGTFGACWMLGFAHRDGTLARMRPVKVIGIGFALIAAGGWWTATHPAPGTGYDLNNIPVGQALISLGVVLLLLRMSPRLRFLDRIPGLRGMIGLINRRAITIYLWHNIAIDLAVPIDDFFGWYDRFAQLSVAAVLTAVAVLAFGWIEDLAARRTVRFLPFRARPAVASGLIS